MLRPALLDEKWGKQPSFDPIMIKKWGNREQHQGVLGVLLSCGSCIVYEHFILVFLLKRLT